MCYHHCVDYYHIIIIIITIIIYIYLIRPCLIVWLITRIIG